MIRALVLLLLLSCPGVLALDSATATGPAKDTLVQRNSELMRSEIRSDIHAEELMRSEIRTEAPLRYGFTLPLRSFLTHFDGSADLYVSFQQLGSWGIERWHSPRNQWYIRTAEILIGSWYHLMMGHYSHELGHDLNSDYYDDSFERSINLLEWEPFPWPRYNRSYSEYNAIEKLMDQNSVHIKDWEGWYEFQEQEFNRVLGGLNLEQWDGRLLYLNTHDVMTWDEGMAFLSRKLSAITYDLYSGYFFDAEPGGFDPELEGDISVYLWELDRRGIEQSRRQFYLQGIPASLLSFRMWESLYHGVRFWAGGTRYYEPFRWTFNDWTVTPPLVEWYLTTRGGYWNLVLPLQFGEVAGSSPGEEQWQDNWQIVLEAGRDADQFGGDLKSKRMAASLTTPSWNSGHFLWTSYAGAGLTLARGTRKWRGASWEIAESLRWKNFEWKSGLVWSRDDLLENHIKNHNNGFRWYGAVTWWLQAE